MTGAPVFHWARGNQTPMSPVQDTMSNKTPEEIAAAVMAYCKQVGMDGDFLMVSIYLKQVPKIMK
jgi:hypothetical protein